MKSKRARMSVTSEATKLIQEGYSMSKPEVRPMRNEMKHTPTPWTLQKFSSGYEIDGANGREVLTMWSNTEDADSDAAFIVRAVNAHEELLSLVQAITEGVEMNSEFIRACEQAIARAEGRMK